MKKKSESQEHGKENLRVVILGDSLLKFAEWAGKRKGYDSHCLPEIRLEGLQHQVSRCNCDTCWHQQH